ncbi:MAG TPA: glycosyltransferase [Blastocatellia bacterium]|nr:glycosyltransferase [Blastocatellia bacterium]
MNKQTDISVVVCTWNRCEMLARALQCLLAQHADRVSYEVVVVDNNSTDRTREVVEALIAQGHVRLRYVCERMQGLSHARNAGIANANGSVIAFTDDDVRVADNWIATIKRAFDEHPDVVCIGGRVLPQWGGEPPAWLTRAHWSPLGAQDYGPEPFAVGPQHRVCLIGANLAFRRGVFDRVGLFEPDFQRVKNGIGSNEDVEFHLRLWRHNELSLYVPDLLAWGFVPPERLSRSYHRRWHRGHGYYYALLREESFERSAGRVLDVPLHVFRQMLTEAAAWLWHRVRGRAEQAFLSEVRLHFLTGFISKRSRDCLRRLWRPAPPSLPVAQSERVGAVTDVSDL